MESKSRKTLVFWYIMRKCLYDANDDDNDDYSDNEQKNS